MDVSGVSKVKVEPEQLKSVAEASYRSVEELRSSLDAIAKFVASTSETWKGSAGDTYRGVFNNEYAHATQVLDEFRSVPKALIDFVGVYSEVISAAGQQVESIPESQFSMD